MNWSSSPLRAESPDPPRRGFGTFTLPAVLFVAALVSLLCAIRTAMVSGYFGTPDLLVISPSTVFAAEAGTGDVLFPECDLTNPGKQAVTVLGASSKCSCTVPEGLPFTLGPGETRKIRLRVAVGSFDQDGLFTKSVELFANREGAIPSLTVQITRAGVAR